MKLKNFLKIKKSNSPILIAEISGNHCGKKSLFLKHIISAAKSGADLIKIQTYEPQDITINTNNKKGHKNNIFAIKEAISKYPRTYYEK